MEASTALNSAVYHHIKGPPLIKAVAALFRVPVVPSDFYRLIGGHRLVTPPYSGTPTTAVGGEQVKITFITPQYIRSGQTIKKRKSYFQDILNKKYTQAKV